MPKSRLKDKIKHLPKKSGVYIFKDKNGAVLYVGKATNLRSRVGSYFKFNANARIYANDANIERPIDYGISQVADIKTIETETVLEAFILEQDLIKRLQPKYNAMGKDDKSFSYVLVTKEDFPRFIIMRKTEVDQISNSPNYSNSPNKITNFKLQITNKTQNPKSKNRIQNTKYKIPYTKIYGPYTSKKQIEIALKILRKIFPYHDKSQQTEKGCLDFQIGLCPGPYDNAINREDYLKNIRGIRMILEGKKKGLIKKLEKEMKDFSRNHEYEKAAIVRNQIFALKHIQDIALIGSSTSKFREVELPIRIEAYDISNISGQYAVGSMIVFDNHSGNMEASKSEYRKFKIKTIQGADDVGMMKEVLDRRFRNAWTKPDLILLDGGAGQLRAGEEVLNNFSLEITLVAATKGRDRKIFNFQFSKFKQFSINEFSNEILKNRNLIQQIMDEAHRFAITYHKKVRKKYFI